MSAVTKRTISGYDRPMVSANVDGDRGDEGLDTTMEDEAQPIHLMARDCSELFEKLMGSSSGPPESEISTFVQEYHGRFNAWASFLGVFASGNASLDHRFQRHPGLQDMVIRLLDVLRRNLFLAVNVYQTSETSHVPISDASGDTNTKKNFDSNLSIAFSSIEETITRLNKLGVTIRLSSRSTSMARARTFAAEHPELIRLNEFEERAHIALQSLYPNASEIVRQQLADSMADRYAKLRYELYRMNAIRTEIHPNLPAKTSDLLSDERELTGLESPQIKFSGNQDAPSPFKINPGVIINFPASSIDTARLRENLKDDNTEVPRVQPKPPRTITVFANQYKEPPLPTFDDAQEYTQCNWCSKRIDRSLTRERRGGLIEWSDIGRHHYKNDLQPYVCVAEGCCKSRPAYSSSRDWFKHMISAHSESWAYNIHNRSSWLCPEEHENDSVYVFSTRDELQDHMLLRHNSPKGSKTLESLIDSAKQHGNENLHLVSSCPLCFFRLETEVASEDEPVPVEATVGGGKRVVSHRKPEKRVKLSAHAKVTTSWEMGSHIAEHLHYLMIVSLRLMSAMDGTSHGDEGAESMNGDSSSRISAPGHDDLNNRLDELPSEVQGSIDWSDINEKAPSTPPIAPAVAAGVGLAGLAAVGAGVAVAAHAASSSGVKLTGRRARVIYDYEKAEDNELELSEGRFIGMIDMIDEDWWYGTNEKGESGLFPSHYVDPIEDEEEEEEEEKEEEEEEIAPSSEIHITGRTGHTAKAVYDYEAAEDNEVSFLEGAIIVGIEFVDEDWWHGTNEKGESGLFPSNYVKLLEDKDEEKKKAAPLSASRAPSPESEPKIHISKEVEYTAKAIYDYEAAEENELSFPESATIVDIEFPDEDWWFGRYQGHEGLFPANYVVLN